MGLARSNALRSLAKEHDVLEEATDRKVNRLLQEGRDDEEIYRGNPTSDDLLWALKSHTPMSASEIESKVGEAIGEQSSSLLEGDSSDDDSYYPPSHPYHR
mgnify:CR=1 FL=1